METGNGFRCAGESLLAWLAALTATGYGLYYLGDEHLREWTAKAHDALGGLALVVLLASNRLRTPSTAGVGPAAVRTNMMRSSRLCDGAARALGRRKSYDVTLTPAFPPAQEQ